MTDCVFCQIIAGELPAKIVYESDTVLAFQDVDPVAPIHYLFVPKKHIVSSNAFAEGEDPSVMADIFAAIAQVAKKEGFAEKGYRIVSNCGEDGGQGVDHLHIHVLGGKPIRFTEFD